MNCSLPNPICWQFKVGDVVKLKSPVDAQVVAIATVQGVWGVDLYHGKEIEPGHLMVTAQEVRGWDTPLVEVDHPLKITMLKQVQDATFLWYQKLMRK